MSYPLRLAKQFENIFEVSFHNIFMQNQVLFCGNTGRNFEESLSTCEVEKNPDGSLFCFCSMATVEILQMRNPSKLVKNFDLKVAEFSNYH